MQFLANGFCHAVNRSSVMVGQWAGIPNIVIPFTADQPFWGERVYAIGAGPKPIPIKKPSFENLTQAILESEDNVIRECAQFVGQETRSEVGVFNAINHIEEYSDVFSKGYIKINRSCGIVCSHVK